MTNNLPAPLPQCPKHGQMELRPGRTPEQRWCGTWYDCIAFRCSNSTLLASPELVASLADSPPDRWIPAPPGTDSGDLKPHGISANHTDEK